MENKKWYKLLSREGVDFMTISMVDTVFYYEIWKMQKCEGELFFTDIYNKNFTHYIGAEPQALGKYLLKKYFNSRKKLEKAFSEGNGLLTRVRKSAGYWQKKINGDSDYDQLLMAFLDFKRDFVEMCYKYSIPPWPAIEYWQTEFEKVISALIKKRGLEKEQELIVLSAFKPINETAIPKLQKELRHNKDIHGLAQKYQFLRSWAVIWHTPIDEAWVKNLIIKDGEEKKLYSKKKLISLLKPNAKEKAYLELTPYLIYLKDWRDDIRREQNYVWSFLFNAIAKKYGVEYDDLGYFTIEEFEQFLRQGKINRELIARRKNGRCIMTIAGKDLKIKVIDKDVPEVYYRTIEGVEANERRFVIKGLVAHKGRATGRVRIIKSFHDIKNVLDGEVLVANTTHPNFLPAMQKASAFITNEGGIMSHAAIVSRELKKPCIVGTKSATTILKDGDLVEVDAELGIVRILNKK